MAKRQDNVVDPKKRIYIDPKTGKAKNTPFKKEGTKSITLPIGKPTTKAKSK